MLLPPVAGYAAAEASPPPTIPIAGQALRRRQPHTAAEPVNPRTPLRAGFHGRLFPCSGSSPSWASPSSTAVVISVQRGQRGQGTTSIGRVLYVERLTARSTATAQFFCDLPSRFVRPVGLQIFQDEESFHSAGRENGLSVMRNGMYIFKTHQTGN